MLIRLKWSITKSNLLSISHKTNHIIVKFHLSYDVSACSFRINFPKFQVHLWKKLQSKMS